MTVPNDAPWSPSPQLLAAYFDGEFEGRDDLTQLRQRLEDWLAASPQGRAELAEYRRLRHLWLQTTPPEPAVTAWQTVQSQLEKCQHEGPVAPRPVRHLLPWKIADLLAGAACILLGIFLFQQFRPAPADTAPFPVASEREVVILHVEGADTGTLVVGELPVQGPLELAGPGDVSLTSVAPAQPDNMIPEIHVSGPGRPIIWARAAAEED